MLLNERERIRLIARALRIRLNAYDSREMNSLSLPIKINFAGKNLYCFGDCEDRLIIRPIMMDIPNNRENTVILPHHGTIDLGNVANVYKKKVKYVAPRPPFLTSMNLSNVKILPDGEAWRKIRQRDINI